MLFYTTGRRDGAVKIATVLSEGNLYTLQVATERTLRGDRSLDPSPSLNDAIQKMFLFGPPDLLMAESAIVGPQFLPTMESLKGQPGFSSIRVVLLCGDRPLPEWVSAAAHFVLPPVPSLGAFEDTLGKIFPYDAVVPVGPAPTMRSPPPPKPEDARRAIRKEISTPCAVLTGGHKHPGRLRDISLGGAKVRVEADLAVGSPLTLNVAVPGTIPPRIIVFKALVVRRDREGYGLSFREMEQETRHFLKHYTEGRILDGPGRTP